VIWHFVKAGQRFRRREARNRLRIIKVGDRPANCDYVNRQTGGSLMPVAAQVLQPQRSVQDVVFGPIESRRFGMSLGINPLPSGARVCNFDCIYCECSTPAWPAKWTLRPEMPDAAQVRRALAEAAE
jgi:hypothetical protein